jgi:hypothetical protein
MDNMIRFRCGARLPREFIAMSSDRLQILNADNSREDRAACDVRVNEIVVRWGIVTAVEPLGGGA